MTPESMKEWLRRILGTRYVYAIGEWEDDGDSAMSDEWFCVVTPTGGPSPAVDVRRPYQRVTLLGPRRGVQAQEVLRDDAESLVTAAMRGERPCGVANVRCLSEPIGPGVTREDRAWVQVNFEIVF